MSERDDALWQFAYCIWKVFLCVVFIVLMTWLRI